MALKHKEDITLASRILEYVIEITTFKLTITVVNFYCITYVPGEFLKILTSCFRTLHISHSISIVVDPSSWSLFFSEKSKESNV